MVRDVLFSVIGSGIRNSNSGLVLGGRQGSWDPNASSVGCWLRAVSLASLACDRSSTDASVDQLEHGEVSEGARGATIAAGC